MCIYSNILANYCTRTLGRQRINNGLPGFMHNSIMYLVAKVVHIITGMFRSFVTCRNENLCVCFFTPLSFDSTRIELNSNFIHFSHASFNKF